MAVKNETSELLKALDIKELSELIKHFHAFTGLNVAVADEHGSVVLTCGKACVCTAVSGGGEKKCAENLVYGGKKAAQLGEPYIFSCGCGLIMCSSPIFKDNKLLGSIACGPALLWEVDDFAESEFALKTKDMFLEKIAVKEVLTKLPNLSCINMTGAAKLLFVIANYMCEHQSKILKQNKEISSQQTQIAELVLNKHNESTGGGFTKSYPQQKEKELIAFVQLGDKNKAMAMLNEVLADIFLYSASDLESIRARLYELTAFMSRATVESGAPLKEVNPILKNSLKILDSASSYEETCHTIASALNKLINLVYESRGKKPSSQHMTNAIKYIKENFNRDISLDDVSRGVFVSVYYLSHLFRSEMNTTFSDYLNSVRMEESKRLLKTTRLTVWEVAERVGFNDANYFAKIFKKVVGITPKQYSSNTGV